MVDWSPIALSVLHRKQLALGAVMVQADGWQHAARFTTPEDETERVREGVGLCDVSPSGKLYLLGDETGSALGQAFPGLGKMSSGGVSVQPSAAADPGEQVVLARLADDEALVVTPPGRAPTVSEAMATPLSGCVHVVNVTSALAAVSIAGPLVHRFLAALTELDVSADAFPDLSCVQTMVAEVHGTLLRRDIGAMPRFDLLFGREYGEYMWDALFEAGPVVPFGIEALKGLTTENTEIR